MKGLLFTGQFSAAASFKTYYFLSNVLYVICRVHDIVNTRVSGKKHCTSIRGYVHMLLFVHCQCVRMFDQHYA